MRPPANGSGRRSPDGPRPEPPPGSPVEADTGPIPQVEGVAESPGDAPAGTVPSQSSLLGTSEAMCPAEGIYAPGGDRPE